MTPPYTNKAPLSIFVVLAWLQARSTKWTRSPWRRHWWTLTRWSTRKGKIWFIGRERWCASQEKGNRKDQRARSKQPTNSILKITFVCSPGDWIEVRNRSLDVRFAGVDVKTAEQPVRHHFVDILVRIDGDDNLGHVGIHSILEVSLQKYATLLML